MLFPWLFACASDGDSAGVASPNAREFASCQEAEDYIIDHVGPNGETQAELDTVEAHNLTFTDCPPFPVGAKPTWQMAEVCEPYFSARDALNWCEVNCTWEFLKNDVPNPHGIYSPHRVWDDCGVPG